MGDGYGYGIQGFFYRYQISSSTISFIPITKEIGYVTSGLIDGKSGLSIILWALGSFTFSLAFFFFLLNFDELGEKILKKIQALFFLSCAFLILSSFAQYGFFFSGPAGISILIGIPILIGVGWAIRSEGYTPETLIGRT